MLMAVRNEGGALQHSQNNGEKPPCYLFFQIRSALGGRTVAATADAQACAVIEKRAVEEE